MRRPGTPVGILDDITNFIVGVYTNPGAYIAVTLLFSVLVALVLPIPIEIVLLQPLLDPRGPQWGYLLAVVAAMATGKTIGAWLIFFVGLRVEGGIRRWADQYKWIDRFVRWAERFVRRTNYIGVYVLLSIPLMSDTVPIYLYSLFNEEGKAVNRTAFLVANFLAAWTRGGFLVLIYVTVGEAARFLFG